MPGDRDTISSREIDREEKVGEPSTHPKGKWFADRNATKLGLPADKQSYLNNLARIAYDRNQEQPQNLEDIKNTPDLAKHLLKKRDERAQGSLEHQIYNIAYNIASMTQHNNSLIVEKGKKIWMANKSNLAVIQALKAAIEDYTNSTTFLQKYNPPPNESHQQESQIPHDQQPQSEIQARRAENSEKNTKRNRITIEELEGARDVFSPDSTDYQELQDEIQARRAENTIYSKRYYIRIEELEGARDVFPPDSTDYQELQDEIQARRAENTIYSKRYYIRIEELEGARDVFPPDSTDYQELQDEI